VTEDVALLEDGTSLRITGVDIPLRTFLRAVINEGLMTVDEVNAWIDRKNQELDRMEDEGGRACRGDARDGKEES
jgi:hypothetical protein